MMTYVRTVMPNRDLVGVEIGVHYGVHALSIMKNVPSIKKLYLVDPYGIEPKDGEPSAHRKLRRFEDRISWIRKYSSDAACEIPDELDFVYIDGDHSYMGVWSDLVRYYRKVRIGGVIGGHDINLNEVLHAFFDFIKYNDIDMFFVGISQANKNPDWWIVKH